jgi:hypothetical protein
MHDIDCVGLEIQPEGETFEQFEFGETEFDAPSLASGFAA